MKKIVFFGILMFITCFISAQNNDLIVTAKGDSIACEILEVTDSEIIFKMKYNGDKNVQTKTNREDIVEFKYDVIQKGMYIFKPGTSYIVSKVYPVSRNTYSLDYLQNASVEELKYYHYKALKQKKTGQIMLITDPPVVIASSVLISNYSGRYDDFGFAMIGGLLLAGIGTTLIGLPILITGSSRVNIVNEIIANASESVSIEIAPYSFHNYITQNNQHGLTLRIRF